MPILPTWAYVERSGEADTEMAMVDILGNERKKLL